MRRLALSLIASCGIALLAACSGGGYGLSANIGNGSTTPDSFAFFNGSGAVNDFFVQPNTNVPLMVSALGYKGSGNGAAVIPDLVFLWQASYAPTGTTYLKSASPNGNGTCGAPPAPAGSTVSNALFVQSPPGTFSPYTGDPRNTVFVGPGSLVGGANYCIVVNAVHVQSGARGGVVVVVSQAP